MAAVAAVTAPLTTTTAAGEAASTDQPISRVKIGTAEADQFTGIADSPCVGIDPLRRSSSAVGGGDQRLIGSFVTIHCRIKQNQSTPVPVYIHPRAIRSFGI